MTAPQDQTDVDPMIIGWHGCISLPDLGLHNFAVKLGTGAKITALHTHAHAHEIETFLKEGARLFRCLSPVAEGGDQDFPD